MSFRFLIKLSRRTLATVVIVVVALITMALTYFTVSNTFFASSFFDQERLGEYTVVGSKWTHFDVFGCTYAIVRASSIVALSRSKNAMSDLANRSYRSNYHWPTPERWQSTPFKPGDWNPESWNFNQDRINEGLPGYFAHCLGELAKADHDAIISAIKTGGGWFSVSGEKVYFVLPSIHVAGAIRYGD